MLDVKRISREINPAALQCSPEEIAIKSFFLGPQAENGAWLKEEVSFLFNSWFAWRRSIAEIDGNAIAQHDFELPQFSEKREELSRLTADLWRRFENEIPKFSPRYVGHMLSELSMPAILGHIIALLHNPNNISGESSRVGSEIEKEAIEMLLDMIGSSLTNTVGPNAVGHFTGGGTVANFEAIARARYRIEMWQALGAYARKKNVATIDFLSASQMGWDEFDRLKSLLPDVDAFRLWLGEVLGSENFRNQMEEAYQEKWRAPAIIISASRHYSWQKGAALFGIPKEALIDIDLDEDGRASRKALQRALSECRHYGKEEGLGYEGRPVALVVSVAGTTELGTVDDITGFNLELESLTREGWYAWHHIDAAYGGFYASLCAGNSQPSGLRLETEKSLAEFARAESVTIDPHKLGYVPYSCGVFLCMDKRNYPHHPVHAPYIDFAKDDDPGHFSIEGSRAATGATATWLMGKSIGLNENGHGRVLRRAVLAKEVLAKQLKRHAGVFLAPGLDLNLVCFLIGNGKTLSELNRQTRRFTQWIQTPGDSQFFVSKTVMTLDRGHEFLRGWLEGRGIVVDTDEVFLARLCLMNPFLTSQNLNTDLLSTLAKKADDYLHAISSEQ